MRGRLLEWLREQGWEVPGALVPDQTMLIGVAFLASAVAATLLARREGLGLRHVTMGLAWTFLGALVGSRVLGFLARIDLVVADPRVLLDPRRTGAISFGALLGGGLVFWLYSRRHKLDLWRYADAMIPAAGLGLFFARLGCLMHGCDYGRITALPWGLRYGPGTPAFEAQVEHGFIGGYQLLTLPTQPLQLVLASWSLVVFLVFVMRPALGRGRLGDRALLAGGLYFGGRFVIEFLRSPYTSPVIGFLNLAQWLCVVSLIVIALLSKLREGHEKEGREEAEEAGVGET